MISSPRAIMSAMRFAASLAARSALVGLPFFLGVASPAEAARPPCGAVSVVLSACALSVFALGGRSLRVAGLAGLMGLAFLPFTAPGTNLGLFFEPFGRPRFRLMGSKISDDVAFCVVS